MKQLNLSNSFCAGFVLYNPENDIFIKSIEVLLSLSIQVIVFDNSTTSDFLNKNIEVLEKAFKSEIIILYSDEGNIGLAAGYNTIVEKVLTIDNCSGLFLFDQDTVLNHNAVTLLIDSFKTLATDGVPFGVLAGYPFRKENVPYRIRPIERSINGLGNLLRVKSVSSSFSLIPLETFKRIGLFRTDFFIDHIDMDFSMRCWNNGLPVYIELNAKFEHNIGIGDVMIFGHYLFPIGDDYRHYYQVRNMIISYSYNDKSVWLIYKDIVVRSLVVLAISVYAGGFVKRYGFLLKGIKDGFKGVTGKLK
ncbi:MAG: WbwY [Daejeonella sp.]|nr:WbwY [Daejeonella sp.]